jgi:sulfite exporter TauE/SafE
MLPISFFAGALLLGAVSSFHCVGMCGPLVLSLPVSQLPPNQRFAGLWLYHGGRIITYALIGLLLGLVGRQISLAGWQQGFSILLGILLVLYFVFTRISKPLIVPPLFRPLQKNVLASISRFIQQPTLPAMWRMGMANGLLPCGMVYVAATGAIASGSISGGMLFMICFGLATIPALYLLSLLGTFFTVPIRQNMRRVLAFGTFVVGILLILRGLNMNLPYISPYLISGTSGTAIDCGR